MTITHAPIRPVADLRDSVAAVQQRVRRLEQQREQLLERRRFRLLVIGASVSMLVHLGLLIYLGSVYRGGNAGVGTGETSYELAIDTSEGLTELDNAELDDLVPDVGEVVEASADDAISELTPAIPSADKTGLSSAMVPSLGGSGGGEAGAGVGAGEGMGLGGGGGGTSFFGVSSKGTRFAYIVDVSGSMGADRKLETALKELSRSISDLPDYAQFYILLFSSDIAHPPGQRGWTRAKKAAIRSVIRWLGTIDPGGGTEPRRAFVESFSLDVRPDVIFFLTDGMVQNFTAEDCAQMNSEGRRVIINTIAFGDPSSQDMLRKMSSDSGGVYRFVPSSGGGP